MSNKKQLAGERFVGIVVHYGSESVAANMLAAWL